MGDDEGLGMGQGSRAGEVEWVRMRLWAWGVAVGLGKWNGVMMRVWAWGRAAGLEKRYG